MVLISRQLPVIILACMCCVAPAFAVEPIAQQISKEGLTLHWGIVSAEKAEGNPEVGPPVMGSIKDMYHLVVAVFEHQTGTRIADAKVSAEVGPLGYLFPTEKRLQPINANGVVSYGNYFVMAKGKTQTITVRIERPDAKPVDVKFRYEHK